MARVLVLFYSRTGTTARLADAVVEGARSVRFAEVDVRRLDDLTPAGTIEGDPAWQESRERLRGQYRTLEDVSAIADYDALVLGGPARHGAMAAELAHLFDRLDALRARGGLADRVGSAFVPASAAHGGQALTLASILAPMGDLGMILAPPPRTDPPAHDGGPGGPAAAGAQPLAADLAAAHRLGARVARIAEWVRHAKGHEHGSGGHHHHHHH